MKTTVQDVMDIMEKWAPVSLAEEWDNVGLLVGDGACAVEKVLVALDVDDNVIKEAELLGAKLIISHHPLIFRKLNSIHTGTALGRRIISLIQKGVSVYSAHTNLDIAFGGTNDVLFDRLALENKELFYPVHVENYGLGRVGNLPEPIKFQDLAEMVGRKLSLTTVNATGNPTDMVYRIAVCTGACGNEKYITHAKKTGCDVLITGDVTYHNAQLALDLGLCVLDATHFATENIAAEAVAVYLNFELERAEFHCRVIPSHANQNTFYPCMVRE